MRADARTRWTLAASAVAFTVVTAAAGQTAQPPPGRSQPRPSSPAGTVAPDAEAVTKRVCGTACHPIEHATSIRRTRAQWEATVENMISRGARGTSAEFATVTEYLAANFGLTASPVRGAAGPDDKPMVDPKAAEMGKPLFVSDCH